MLSHTSAAELWGMRRRVHRPFEAGGRVEVSDVHVTVPSTAGIRKREGIVLHRSSTLIARHCTRHDGIPVTTPGRTLDDLQRLLSPAEVAAARREAEFLRLALEDQFAPGGGRTKSAPGRARSKSASVRARSELEQRMLAICRRHRLPHPEVNVKVDRFEVDFLWRDQRLIVEVDGWEAHQTRSAFEDDRARDARLAVLRYEVVRFTWRQVIGEPAHVARTIRALLGARAA